MSPERPNIDRFASRLAELASKLASNPEPAMVQAVARELAQLAAS